jgi:hypothetical protein
MQMEFNFKSINMGAVKRMMSSQGTHDLNLFLEKMPQLSGQTALIAAAVAWTCAATLGLFTTIQVQNMTKLRAELKEMKAVQPSVPVIKDVPVPQDEIKAFVASLTKIYPGLDIKQQGNSIQIGAKTTSMYGSFREAVGHVQNGGVGWRVAVDKICVGRECKGNTLAILLKVNKVSVDKPN